MASSFYSRYVPGKRATTTNGVQTGLEAANSNEDRRKDTKKRKRDVDGHHTPTPQDANSFKKSEDKLRKHRSSKDRSGSPEQAAHEREQSSLKRKEKKERHTGEDGVPEKTKAVAQGKEANGISLEKTKKVKRKDENAGQSERKKKQKREREQENEGDGEGDGEVGHIGDASSDKEKVAKTAKILGKDAEESQARESMPKKKRKKEKDTISGQSATDNGVPVESDARHHNVLSKFEKSRKISASSKTKPAEDIPSEDPLLTRKADLRGLEPMPQPEQVPETEYTPSFSALPAWLTQPMGVTADSKIPMGDLSMGDRMKSTLEARGYKEAFAVQSAVIPLLLDGPQSHSGDVCISAATGSGKTLAYAAPMIEALQNRAVTRLRGLVVVPTRELVKQARDMCELCATGTGLQIGTAVGSKSLKEEQKLLIKPDQRYDPEACSKTRNPAMTVDDWATFDFQELVDRLDEKVDMLPDHVVDYISKVDILICTPGRLVDHLRSTKGFTLDHIEWLVIDEADRLLNESFQEWVDIVMPALENVQRTDLAAQILREMKFSIRPKIIKKVVMSATMTRDVSKLAALKLRNPKLVEVTNIKKPEHTDGNAMDIDPAVPGSSAEGYELPSTLRECMVPVGDGSEKPLCLLDILTRRILPASKKIVSENSSDSSSSSSDDSTDTESSSGPDSESDSDSATDSTSSSDSDVTSSSGSSAASSTTPVKSREKADNNASQSTNSVLIFTASTQSAHRLAHLLSLLAPNLAPQITTLTKSSSSSTTRRALASFHRNTSTPSSITPTASASILIATDRASRGLDLPSLGHVISYDVPSSLTTYIHRVGRTARAGREGMAWTLVTHSQGKWFWEEIGRSKMVKRVARVEKVGRIKLDEEIRSRYRVALGRLEEEVKRG